MNASSLDRRRTALALLLLAGTSFGTRGGTLLVGAASTLGARVSFLVARHLAREAVRRIAHRLQPLDPVAAREGALWLFRLRRVPLLPCPVRNPLLGLSRLSVPALFWPGLAGLTLGSLPYICVGEVLAGSGQGDMPTLWAMAGGATGLAAMAWRARQRMHRLAAVVGPPT